MNSVSNEDVFAACVAILSRLIEAEQRGKGVNRLGGGYTTEALQEIARVKAHLPSR
jgi:hypothetical protein